MKVETTESKFIPVSFALKLITDMLHKGTENKDKQKPLEEAVWAGPVVSEKSSLKNEDQWAHTPIIWINVQGIINMTEEWQIRMIKEQSQILPLNVIKNNNTQWWLVCILKNLLEIIRP